MPLQPEARSRGGGSPPSFVKLAPPSPVTKNSSTQTPERTLACRFLICCALKGRLKFHPTRFWRFSFCFFFLICYFSIVFETKETVHLQALQRTQLGDADLYQFIVTPESLRLNTQDYTHSKNGGQAAYIVHKDVRLFVRGPVNKKSHPLPISLCRWLHAYLHRRSGLDEIYYRVSQSQPARRFHRP